MKTNTSDIPTTTSPDTTKTLNMQIKNTWKHSSNLPSSKNVTIILVFFISLFSPSSDLLSSLLADLNGKRWSSQWTADIWRCWREDMSPSTVFLLSFLLRRRRTCSEDTRKQKLQVCVLPELSLLLPHTAKQRKRKAGHQAHPLQGKHGQAHEHLRAMSKLSKPRKQLN